MSMFFIPSIIEGISAKFNKEGYKFLSFLQKNLLEIEKKIYKLVPTLE